MLSFLCRVPWAENLADGVTCRRYLIADRDKHFFLILRQTRRSLKTRFAELGWKKESAGDYDGPENGFWSIWQVVGGREPSVVAMGSRRCFVHGLHADDAGASIGHSSVYGT